MTLDEGIVDVSTSGTSPCFRCGKPTRSHGVAVKIEENGILPGDWDNYDLLHTLCHTCLTEVDSWDELVGRYEEKLAGELTGDLGFTAEQLLDNFKKGSKADTPDKKVFGQSGMRELLVSCEHGNVLILNDTMRINVMDKNKLSNLIEDEERIEGEFLTGGVSFSDKSIRMIFRDDEGYLCLSPGRDAFEVGTAELYR